MVDAVNNNAYSAGMVDRTQLGATAGDQSGQQSSMATQEVQGQQKQSDTVTISQEALAAQNGAQTAPEQARVQAMETAQKPAANPGIAQNSPMQAVAQAYGVSE